MMSVVVLNGHTKEKRMMEKFCAKLNGNKSCTRSFHLTSPLKFVDDRVLIDL